MSMYTQPRQRLPSFRDEASRVPTIVKRSNKQADYDGEPIESLNKLRGVRKHLKENTHPPLPSYCLALSVETCRGY